MSLQLTSGSGEQTFSEVDGLPEDMSKDAEVIAQKMTDEYGKKADEYFAKKEKDIMTI